MPPALGRFSTITVWPSGLPIAWPRMRDTVSVGPPAAYGTTIEMLRVGYCCAAVPALKAARANNEERIEIRFIDFAPEGLARPAGFEPTTLGFGGQYSNPLSYGRLE